MTIFDPYIGVPAKCNKRLTFKSASFIYGTNFVKNLSERRGDSA
jgi:hypothetical protein